MSERENAQRERGATAVWSADTPAGQAGERAQSERAQREAHGEGAVLLGLFGLAEEQTWQERALCAQTDPEAFFPEKGGSTREAKRICSTCEVRTECLEYALEHDERFGIWGGLSERERRRVKRRAV
jgi:WhiB family redox-sensing transcriptional regulator